MPALPGPTTLTIDVSCERATDTWSCHVRVTERGTTTEHDVRVATVDLARLDAAASEPDDLVRRSFEFLLAREPRESILRSFDLPVIGRYFPEYEREIRGR
ncbi:MAG: hypothetical protein ACJ77B_12990 [Chloroflexota bacterium]